MRPATAPLRLTDGQREILEKLAVARAAPHREVTRARALLLAGDGVATTAVARAVGASPASVTAWRERFAAEGLANFGKVSAGRGRRRSARRRWRRSCTPPCATGRPARRTGHAAPWPGRRESARRRCSGSGRRGGWPRTG